MGARLTPAARGVPSALDAQRRLGADWGDWLDRLPQLRDTLVREWQLTPDGPPDHGYCSLVLPVRTSDGEPAVLKISFDGDDESAHEALALHHWHGDGAVRLLTADPLRRAMLLERLHPVDLSQEGDVEACEVVAGLYRRLHRPALPQLRTVTSYVDRWLDDLEALGRELPVPPRMVEQALHLGRALVSDARSTGVVVHGDLHYGNVLAAERDPWLAIDPKPMDGDPHYDPAPLLWTRWEEMADPSSPQRMRTAIRRRFHTVVDAAGLDEDRARSWVIVRVVLNASWSALHARRAGRALDTGDRGRITRCVTVVKAVQE